MSESVQKQGFGTVASATYVEESGKVFKGPHYAIKVITHEDGVFGADFFFVNAALNQVPQLRSPVFIQYQSDVPAGDQTLWAPVQVSYYGKHGGIITVAVPPRGMGSPETA